MTDFTIPADDPRLATLVLKGLSHKSPKDGVCIMEAAAWLAGEPHSDAPRCVSVPELRRLAIRLNDARWPSDADRTRVLLPYLPRLMGATASEKQRAAIRFKMADIACREIAPEALDRRGFAEHAAKLRALAPIVDKATAEAGRKAARAAADAADAAADPAHLETLTRWTRRLLDAALEIVGR